MPGPAQPTVICSEFKNAITRKADPLCTLPMADRKQSQHEFKLGMKARDKEDYRAALEHFRAAAALAPRELPYATAVEVARQQFVHKTLDFGNSAMLHGKKAEALAAFRNASEVDPDNEFAKQRLRDAMATLPSMRPPVLQSDLAETIRLSPDPAKHTIHFRGNAHQLLEQLARTYRLTGFVDESVINRSVRADIEDATWDQALRAINKLTKTFWTPLAPNQILFAADDEQNRRMLLRTSLRTFYVFQASSAQELNDLANSLRVLFDIRFVVVNPVQGTITIRAAQQVVEAASAFMRQLESARPQVMLDIEVFQVSSSITRQLGVSIPNSFTVFNVPTEAQKLLGGKSIQEIIAELNAGTLNLSASTALGALLGQSAQSSPLLQPFATFGGGSTLTGITIPALVAQFNQNSSALRSVERISLRAGQGSPAVLKIGTRYPIVTSNYTSVYSLPQLIPQASAAQGLANYPSFTYEDLGVNVKATPTVHRSGDVQLDLEMQVRALGAQAFPGIPVISNREYKGVITAKDGSQVVIAGQLTRSEELGMSGIPLLSALPGAGHAFTQDTKTTNESELLIVLTPHVLTGLNPPDTQPIAVPDFIPR